MDINSLILHFGYPAVFILVFVEGPLVTMAAAFGVALGYFNLFILFPLIIIADLLADIMWYSVGYFGREKLVSRWGHFVGLTVNRLSKMEKIFGRHQGKILFMAKITHAIGFPFLIAAGLGKLNFKKYCFFNFLATVPKSFIFMGLGYYFGQAHELISDYLGYSTIIGLILLAFAILVFILFQRLMNNYFSKNYEHQA